MNIDDWGHRLADFLGGHHLVKTGRVSVYIDGESAELEDSLVLFRDDGRCAQVLLEQAGPRLRDMLSSDDYEIVGEYRDRTNDSLNTAEFENGAFRVSAISVAYETGATTGDTYSIGVFVLDSQGHSRVSLVCHTDDVGFGPGSLLWDYLGLVMAQSGLISIKRFTRRA